MNHIAFIAIILFFVCHVAVCQEFVVYSGDVCQTIVDFNITANSSTQSNIDSSYIENYIDTFPSWTPEVCRKSLRVVSCLTAYLPYKYPSSADNQLCEDICSGLTDYCAVFIENDKNYNEGSYSFVFENCSSLPTSNCYEDADVSMESYPANPIDDPSCPSPLVVSSSSAVTFEDGSSCAYPCPNYDRTEYEFTALTNTLRVSNSVSLAGGLITLCVWSRRALRKSSDTNPFGKKEAEFVILIAVASCLIDVAVFGILSKNPFDFLCSSSNDVVSSPLCIFQAITSYAGFAFILVWAAAQSVHLWCTVIARIPSDKLNSYKYLYRFISILLPAVGTSIILTHDGFGNDTLLAEPTCWIKTELSYNIYLGVYVVPNALLTLLIVLLMSHVCFSVACIIYSASRYNRRTNRTSNVPSSHKHSDSSNIQTRDGASRVKRNPSSIQTPLLVPDSVLQQSTANFDGPGDNSAIMHGLYEAFRVNRRMVIFIVLFGLTNLCRIIGDAVLTFGPIGADAENSAHNLLICLLNNADAIGGAQSVCGSSPDIRIPMFYSYFILISATSISFVIFLVYGPRWNWNIQEPARSQESSSSSQWSSSVCELCTCCTRNSSSQSSDEQATYIITNRNTSKPPTSSSSAYDTTMHGSPSRTSSSQQPLAAGEKIMSPSFATEVPDNISSNTPSSSATRLSHLSTSSAHSATLQQNIFSYPAQWLSRLVGGATMGGARRDQQATVHVWSEVDVGDDDSEAAASRNDDSLLRPSSNNASGEFASSGSYGFATPNALSSRISSDA